MKIKILQFCVCMILGGCKSTTQKPASPEQPVMEPTNIPETSQKPVADKLTHAYTPASQSAEDLCETHPDVGGFLDRVTISNAFDAIQQSKKTSEEFDRGVYWIDQISNLCARESFADPKGNECSKKLAGLSFAWLEFNRSGSNFRFLIAQ